MYKNPFYIAELQASNCQVELLINDVPCFNQYNDGGVGVDWPINEYILNSGKQFYTIKANCFDNENKIRSNASISLKITLRDAFDFSVPKKVIKEHIQINFNEKDTQIFESGDFFEAHVPYSLSGWKDSFDFSNYIHGNNDIKQALVTEIKDYYELFYQVLKAQDVNKYNLINSQRFEEITTAFYLTKQEKDDRKKSILNSSRRDISKVDFNEYSLHFYGNKNQIVGMKIKNQPCGFVFENEEGMIITELALFHRKISDNKLSLIR